jgi:hypothetical protein
MRMRWSLSLPLVMAAVAVACGSSNFPTGPTQQPLPLVSESAHYGYHYASGDVVDSEWQEAYHQWATTRLGVQLPKKIGYYKYRSRLEMGQHTGTYNTNGYADPVNFEIHTLWATDHHEVVHLFMSTIGQDTALFAEGIAVAFMTDPPKGDFRSVFNGEEVHNAARRYLQSGTLVLPLDRIIETKGFRAVSDSELSYREAGSFVRFLIDTYGLDRFIAFYRLGTSVDETADTIKSHFRSAMGVSFEDAEAAWLTMLRAG